MVANTNADFPYQRWKMYKNRMLSNLKISEIYERSKELVVKNCGNNKHPIT